VLAEKILSKDIKKIAEVVSKAATEGDLNAARLVLRYLVPPAKGKVVRVRMPKIESVDDIACAMQAVWAAVSTGAITIDEMLALTAVLEKHRAIVHASELEKRIIALEASNAHVDRSRQRVLRQPRAAWDELYLAIEDIDHSRTKTKSPQTNGICERFHKTVLNEFYRVAFRKKVYRSIDELQVDLDAWIRDYNEARPHQGRWCYGKTPMQTFLDAMPLTKEKMIAA
jgi:transposase InsO family protein